MIDYNAILEEYSKLHEGSGEFSAEYHLAMNQYSKKDYKNALENFKKSAEKMTQRYGQGKYAFEGHILKQMTYCYLNLSDAENAKTCLKKAIKIYKGLPGDDKNALADAYKIYGQVFMDLGDYDKARSKFEKLLSIKVKKFGENHKELVMIYQVLAYCFLELNRPQDSMVYSQKGLEILQNGNNDAISDIFYLTAHVKRAEGAIKEAIEYYKAAMDFYEAAKSENLGNLYYELGKLYLQENNSNEAAACFERAQKIWTEQNGKHHFCMNKLASISLPQKNEIKVTQEIPKVDVKPVETIPIEKNVVDVKSQEDKKDDIISKAESLIQLADSQIKTGKKHDAASNYLKAFKILDHEIDQRISTMGENHPDVAKIFSLLGYFYTQQNNLNAGLNNLNTAIEIYEKNYDINNPDISATYFRLGNAWFQKKEYEFAMMNYMKALNARLQVLGDNHLQIAEIYHAIGMNLMAQKKEEEAAIHFEKAYEIRKKLLGEDDQLTIETLCLVFDAKEAKN